MKNKEATKLLLAQTLQNQFIFPFILFTGIWLYIFLSTNMLSAGFNYFLDDHQILINHHQNFSFYKIFIDPFTSLFSGETNSRFRPLYDVFLRLFSQLYGLNSLFWYLSSLAAAIATTNNFYIFARLQSFPILESICFALLVVLGEQASTYGRFGTPETTSTFLISLAFLFCSLNVHKTPNKNLLLNFLFVLFAILAALNKEACILMLPAFAFFKIWFSCHLNKISIKQSLFVNREVVFSLLSAFVLFFAYIKLSGVSGPGYAGIDKDTFSMTSLSELFRSLSQKSSLTVAIVINIIYFLCFLGFKKNRLTELDLGFYVLVSLIVIPQLILYSKSGIYLHYLLPCVIGISLLTIYPLVKLQKQFSKYFKILILLIIIIIIHNNFIVTYNDFNNRSLSLHNLQAMVQDISACIDDDSHSIIFGNPYIHYERLYGYKNALIDKIFKKRNNSFILATYGSLNSNLKSDVVKEDEISWLFLNPRGVEGWYNNKTINTVNQQSLSKTQNIVVFGYDKFKNDFEKLTSDWFDAKQFNFKYYEGIDIGVYCNKSNQSSSPSVSTSIVALSEKEMMRQNE